MAKQTIIVMSDSHGASCPLLKLIKGKYLRSGRWDLSQWGLELKRMKGSTLSKEIRIFMMAIRTLATQLGPTRIIQTMGILPDQF